MIEKMFKKIAPLTTNNKEITFAPRDNYKHAKSLGAIAVSYTEMPEASKHYPLFFIKDGENFTPIALLGIDNSKNLFVSKNGDWSKGRYIPSLIRLYPFVLSKTEEKENGVAVAFDKEYEGLDSKGGQRFFKDDGSLDEFGSSIMKQSEDIFNSIHRTTLMSKEVEKLGLLSSVDVTLGKEKDSKHKIKGLFQVNGEKLNQLSDEELLNITKNGALHMVYNHLDSLSNFSNLINKLG